LIYEPLIRQGRLTFSTEHAPTLTSCPSKSEVAPPGSLAEHCQQHGADIAQLALQFSVANEDMTTCVTGSANPTRVRQWAEWIEQPLDEQLLNDVQAILAPIHNWFYIEGRPENNDVPEG